MLGSLAFFFIGNDCADEMISVGNGSLEWDENSFYIVLIVYFTSKCIFYMKMQGLLYSMLLI